MRKTSKILSLLVGFVLLSTSCNDFLDINTDPNNPATSTTELTLPAGIASVAFVMGDYFQILGSFWSQHWTQATAANQYAYIDDYNIDDGRYNAAYTELYAGALNDLNYVSKQAEASQDWNYYFIAEVMKVYTFQVLVDYYNNIPYFDAIKGAGNLTPAFDQGQDIYDDLIVKLDNALAKDLTAFTARPVNANSDLIFEGDMEQWVRFANTLKLKIYLRQSEARPALAQAGIEALFASGAEFLEDEDGEMTAFEDTENFRNPFYATQISTAGGGRGYVDVAASATLLNYLQTNTDPRLPAIFSSPVAGGPQVGLTQGDYSNTTFNSARNLSQPNITATHPVVLISIAESKFLQAEAVQRYGVAGDAKALYEAGIEASFAKHGVTGASVLYAAGEPYEYDSANAIEQIITQKWIAMANFQGTEAYFEFLRTGYPDFFTATPNNVTGDIFPQRLPYPSTEVNNNRENLEAAGGQVLVTQRVWWNPA